jgi:hypothetical protein
MLSFDRSTIVIVVTVWAAAVVMMIVALYTLSLSGSAHRAMEEALAAEPVLPKIERTDNNREDARKMVDRLKKKYDGISFENSNEGQIGFIAANPENFGTWLAALTYLDTIAPDTRWSLASMCVGGECGADADGVCAGCEGEFASAGGAGGAGGQGGCEGDLHAGDVQNAVLLPGGGPPVLQNGREYSGRKHRRAGEDRQEVWGGGGGEPV